MSDEREQRLPDEDELKGALPESEEAADGSCPSRATLKGFVDGQYGMNEPALTAILDHSADCEHCERQLAQIRIELTAKEKFEAKVPQHHWVRWKAVYVACGLAIVAAIWFSGTLPRTSATVTVDLRHVTRGGEPSSAPGELILYRNTSQIRLLIPMEAIEGKYELGIFSVSDLNSPVLTGFASARVEKEYKVVQVRFALKGLSAGSYELGIRQADSVWRYYPFTLE